MKHKDGKPIYEKNYRVVPMTVLLVTLCVVSFYLGKVYCPEKDIIMAKGIGKAVGSSKEAVPIPLQVKSITFPECGIDYQDYTPCTDPKLMKWDHYNFESAMGPASMELLTPYLGVLGRWKLRRSFVRRNGETMKWRRIGVGSFVCTME